MNDPGARNRSGRLLASIAVRDRPQLAVGDGADTRLRRDDRSSVGGCACNLYDRHWPPGRWSYNHRMPVEPVLETGLWPLLQLTLLVPAAIGIATWRARRRFKEHLAGDGSCNPES